MSTRASAQLRRSSADQYAHFVSTNCIVCCSPVRLFFFRAMGSDKPVATSNAVPCALRNCQHGTVILGQCLVAKVSWDWRPATSTGRCT